MEREVHLQHFARFRELRGQSAETVTTRARTPRELFAELDLTGATGLDPAWVRVAVNDAFTSWDAELQGGDRVAFLAPMSGG